jgi:RNA polymerase sigma factor (sigma-70 family)
MTPNHTNQLVEKHISQVNKLAWSFAKTTGHEFDDLKSEGTIAMLRAIKKFNPNHGCELSTLIHTTCRNAMVQYLKDQGKKFPDMNEEVDVADHRPNGHQRYEFLESLSSLGTEAKQVLRIIFESPKEMTNITAGNSAGNIRKTIERTMRDMGFKGRGIEQAFNQIRSTFQN